MSWFVDSYASRTQSTILPGSGEYSNSMLIAVEACRSERFQVRRKIDDAPSGRQVSVLSAVTIRQMDVRDAPTQFRDSIRRVLNQSQMRNIDVGFYIKLGNVFQKAVHAVDAVYDGQVKRFEFNRDFQAETVGILPEFRHAFDGPFPLIGGRDDFLVPDVFADHK